MSIHSISLKNFKSIRDANDIRFGAINVLIGANGSGKSNLISFFKLLNNIINQNLQVYINTTGRAGSYLYFEPKVSNFIGGEIQFLNGSSLANRYRFKLIPTQDDSFIFENEYSDYNQGNNEVPHWNWLKYNTAANESAIPNDNITFRNRFLIGFFRSLRVFHFHDTSSNALVKKFCNFYDNSYLKEDASNLPAFLYKLSITHPKNYNLIEKTIQSVAPFFNRFDLKPTSEQQPQINLKWFEKGSDDYFDANNLSDGTLRFICLTTLLLQPDPPATIIIDEPELGLHPSAIDKLAAMIQSASVKTQIIVSTQSINLLNNFEAKDVIVVEREDNQSVFKRLDAESLKDWLEDYTLGELWYKNVIGGKPQ